MVEYEPIAANGFPNNLEKNISKVSVVYKFPRETFINAAACFTNGLTPVGEPFTRLKMKKLMRNEFYRTDDYNYVYFVGDVVYKKIASRDEVVVPRYYLIFLPKRSEEYDIESI